MIELLNKFKELDKLEFIKKNDRIISITLIAFSGMLCIGMGTTLELLPEPVVNKTVIVSVNQGRVEETEQKSNEIILKEMTSEVNKPISVDVKDYVEDTLDSKVLNKLKLDTSAVNISEPGTYTYTITYKKKTYNGVYVITEKPLPQVDNMTLKELRLTVGSELPQNLEAYIVEQLAAEVVANIKIDLSKVNVNKAGDYQYTVTYNGKFYTGKIIIYEPQPTIVKPSEESKKTEQEKDSEPEEQVVEFPTE